MASKPTISIVSPTSGSQFHEGDDVAIQSTSTDSAGVVRVELSVDGTAARIDTPPSLRAQPSFTVVQAWKAVRGDHTISVRAYNAAEVGSDPATITLSVAAGAAPPPTSAPVSSTGTPQAARTATPSTAGACKDAAAFVSDLTIPDNTTVTASAVLDKMWQVRNTGTCTWGDGYQLVFRDGEAMTAATSALVPSTSPGATADLKVSIIAPAVGGTHKGRWDLRTPGGTTLTTLTIVIVVPGAAGPTGTGGMAIQSFTASIQNIATGKRLTFAWQSTGGTNARIISGASIRFPQAWPVPTSGNYSVDVPDVTINPNPSMTLVVSDDKGNQVTQSAQVVWPCKYSYFFAPAPGGCPDAPVATAAAQESFQAGRMIWIDKTGDTTGKLIVVLYNDGHYEQYADTWTTGMPETSSDPQFVPPVGLVQPRRGFGKVWRENPPVRQGLGWATTIEKGYDTTWQNKKTEAPPTVGYVRTSDNHVIELTGSGGSGSWRNIGP